MPDDVRAVHERERLEPRRERGLTLPGCEPIARSRVPTWIGSTGPDANVTPSFVIDAKGQSAWRA
jgi:hypothetical protein